MDVKPALPLKPNLSRASKKINPPSCPLPDAKELFPQGIRTVKLLTVPEPPNLVHQAAYNIKATTHAPMIWTPPEHRRCHGMVKGKAYLKLDKDHDKLREGMRKRLEGQEWYTKFVENTKQERDNVSGDSKALVPWKDNGTVEKKEEEGQYNVWIAGEVVPFSVVNCFLPDVTPAFAIMREPVEMAKVTHPFNGSYVGLNQEYLGAGMIMNFVNGKKKKKERSPPPKLEAIMDAVEKKVKVEQEQGSPPIPSKKKSIATKRKMITWTPPESPPESPPDSPSPPPKKGPAAASKTKAKPPPKSEKKIKKKKPAPLLPKRHLLPPPPAAAVKREVIKVDPPKPPPKAPPKEQPATPAPRRQTIIWNPPEVCVPTPSTSNASNDNGGGKSPPTIRRQLQTARRGNYLVRKSPPRTPSPPTSSNKAGGLSPPKIFSAFRIPRRKNPVKNAESSPPIPSRPTPSFLNVPDLSPEKPPRKMAKDSVSSLEDLAFPPSPPPINLYDDLLDQFNFGVDADTEPVSPPLFSSPPKVNEKSPASVASDDDDAITTSKQVEKEVVPVPNGKSDLEEISEEEEETREEKIPNGKPAAVEEISEDEEEEEEAAMVIDEEDRGGDQDEEENGGGDEEEDDDDAFQLFADGDVDDLIPDDDFGCGSVRFRKF